ncbi:MAG TPA: GNAT family N-acetyltransferase [Thermoplasmatales archaeon]|nr:GNAT family N-acetyltransferase [Thermoplasmatales archaeon]
MSFKIRKAKIDDLKAFVEVYKSAYQKMQEYAYTKEKDIKHYFKWLLKRDANGFFVAEVEEKPVGFIACDAYWHNFFDESMGEIHEIVVEKGYTGKGIGKKLIEVAEEYLKGRGYKKIGLWVGEKNHEAKKFYEKLGYKEGEKFGKWIRMIKSIE